MGSRSCRGFLHVTKEMMVIRAHIEHTHPPSTTFLKKLQAEFAREIKIKKTHDKEPYSRNSKMPFKISNVHGGVGY